MSKYLFFSLGDPAGVGPTIAAHQLKNKPKDLGQEAIEVWVGHPKTLLDAAGSAARSITTLPQLEQLPADPHLASQAMAEHLGQLLSAGLQDSSAHGRQIYLYPVGDDQTFAYGQPNPNSGLVSYYAFSVATDLCLWATKKNARAALITGPLSKEYVAASIPNFRGHTEVLSEKTGQWVEMCLSVATDDGRFSVIPLTRHIPLVDVSRALLEVDLEQTIGVLAASAHWLGIDQGRPIGLLGLNPHAGDGGTIGREEMQFLNTWPKRFTDAGLAMSGPHPADGFFGSGAYKNYSLVLGMYHDQVLIPFKLLAGYQGVNVTLGLPFFRVSPDHGPAYNLSHPGEASAQSLAQSFQAAWEYLGQGK